MRSWGPFYLALVVAIVFALLGFYYLLPNVYHPLTADTVLRTTPHLTPAAVFWVLAVVAVLLGGLVRPGTRK